MKKILITILILISLTTIGQDKQLFNYINEYRVVNNKKQLKWSDKLVKISIGQNNKNIKDKSLSHSQHNSYENCLMGVNIASSRIEQKDFIKFTKKYFNYKYDVHSDITKEELLNLTKMYMVYLWHTSPKHKDNLLRVGVEYCSAESYIADNFDFFDGSFKVNGKIYTYRKIATHYSVDYYATMNLR